MVPAQKNRKNRHGEFSKSGKKDKKIIPLEEDLKILQEIVMQTLDESNFIVFDIETTGGNPEKNGITEICAIKYTKGEVKDKFYTLVNPLVSIPPIVRRMTGINNKMVRKAPPIKYIMPDFLEFIGQDILVSHNTIGDLKFLNYFAEKVCKRPLRNFFLCTHLLTEKLISESNDKSLMGLAKFLGIEGGTAHRAEADTFVTKDLFKELVLRLAKENIFVVKDAIRFQGDLESSMRLGWGLKEDDTFSQNNGIGVIQFFDRDNKRIFLTSSFNCAKSISTLKKLYTLPKQLIRIILKTYKLQIDSYHHIFSAMYHEALYLSQAKMKLEPHQWHLRQIIALCIIQKSSKQIALKVCNINENTIYAFGPVRDKKGAHQLIGNIANALKIKLVQHELHLDNAAINPLVAFFQGEGLSRGKMPLWAHLFQWQMLIKPDLRKGFLYEIKVAAKLKQISHAFKWKNILQENGIFVLPAAVHNEWYIYPILNSVPQEPEVIDMHWKEWLFKKESGHEFISKLYEKYTQLKVAPINKKDSYLCKVTLWMIFGRKGQHMEHDVYYDIKELHQELLSKGQK